MRNDVSFMKLRAIKRYSKLFYDWLFFFVSFGLGSLHTLTCITLLLGLCGCQTADPNADIAPKTNPNLTVKRTENEPDESTKLQTKPEFQTEPQTEIVTVPETGSENDQPPNNDEQYCTLDLYSNIDEYLQKFWEKQSETNGDFGLNSNSHTVSIVTPILKKSGFELIMLTAYGSPVTDGRIIWTFAPIDREYDSSEYYVSFTFYFDSSFTDKVAEIHGDTPNPDEYGGVRPYFLEWYFKIDDYSVSVDFPFSATTDKSYVPFETVLEYFDFEVVTYSPNAETDAVQ